MEFYCKWFSPCPICKKCMNVADTFYERCRKCGYSIQKCKHGERERNLMIRRSNFTMKISNEAKEEIKKLGEKVNE
jgi:predicted amidophosphoribosyltransferase